MKRIILFLFFICLTFSCTEEEMAYYREQERQRKIVQSIDKKLEEEIKANPNNLYDLSVHTFLYKGHNMVMVTSGSGDHAIGGVFHDPECEKCMKEESLDKQNDVLSDYERIFGNFN